MCTCGQLRLGSSPGGAGGPGGGRQSGASAAGPGDGQRNRGHRGGVELWGH